MTIKANNRFTILPNDGTHCTGVWDNPEARACGFVIIDTTKADAYPFFAKTEQDARDIADRKNAAHDAKVAHEATFVEITTGGYTRKVDPKVAARIKMERKVISAFVKSALKAGHVVSVNNGEDCPVKRSASYKAIMAGIMQTDEDRLIVRDAKGAHVGTAYMVYGNDGWDVICDYHTSLESLMPPVNAVVDRLSA